MLRPFLTFLICFTVFYSNAQKKVNPTSKDVEQAKSLKNSFEEEDIIFISRNSSLTFRKNSREGLIEVFKKEKTKMMNISSSSGLQFPVYYDSESEVEDFQIKDRNGKKYYSRILDENIAGEGLFHSDYRVKYSNLNFPLQGYQYIIDSEKKYKDIKYFTSEYFVDSYRILNGTYTITIPDWLEIELKEFNFEGYEITKTVTEVTDTKVVTYTFNDMEPQSAEENTPGPSFLYPHILFLSKSYTENEETISLFKDTGDLYNWYNGLIKSVDVDTSVFSDKVDELIADADTDEEKIKNIYYWVQDNIRYIAFEDGIAGFKPDSPQNVYTKLYGDCKGMALLTKSMLEVAGFDSRLVWIGTDRLVYDYSTPSLSVDNHMICSVILNEETIFLDGTEKYNRFGEYASRIQNKQALIQDNDSYKLLTVPKPKEEINIDKTIYNLKVVDEELVGEVSRIFEGEARVMFQNTYLSFGAGEQEEILKSYLISGNKNCSVKEISPFESEKREEQLKIDYKIEIENAFSEFDGVLYLDIDPIKDASNFLFKDRKTDYKFPFNELIITEVTIEIPKGYKAENLPENIEITNDFIAIKVTYQVSGNSLVYKKEIQLKNRLIKTTDFEDWNNAFSKLKDNLSEQITLIKH